MIQLQNPSAEAAESIGAVRVRVRLTNAVDEELVKHGLLNPDTSRSCEAEALIDIGAVRTVLPETIVSTLGLSIRGQQIAKYANSSEERIDRTGPVIIEIEGRETIEATLVTGDIVLIGQTVLETLDFWVDCKN
ncbi:MAG: clan AA aspartic protease [Thermosynechococcaceae cyanobacterium]